MLICLLECLGGGVQATEEDVDGLIMEAIYNSEGAGAYTFSRSTLGDSYPNAEFDWVNSKYAQSEIVPGAEYLIITVGCNDEGGQNPSLCHQRACLVPKQRLR